ncbi:MAG TPA: hypothetical protein VMS93_06705 [Candidatus Saccharimonadales bacterium]|nr:hypothetical protein [Candidatus Saccharimonadales bacterium]
MPMDRRGSVNWQDGMLIEASHLAAETEYLRGLSGRAAAVGLGGFGVLGDPGEAAPLDLSVAVAGSECTAELKRLRGFFPDGTWVEYEAQGPDAVVARAAVEPRGEQSLGVYVLAHDDEYLAFGEPDPREDPPRRPFRQPRLELRLGADPGWPRARSLKLGAVQVRDGVAGVDPGALPAAATMASWPALRDLAARHAERLERWRRIAVDNFIVLLPVATAPAGGTGREVEYAKRETAFQWGVEVARLQAAQELLARTASPARWMASLQAGARTLLTLVELNRDLSKAMQQASTDFEAGVGALRQAVAFRPDPEALHELVDCAGAYMDGVDRLLAGLFTAKGVRSDILRYRDQEYQLTSYSRRVYRREGEREYLEISGLAVASVEDYVVVMEGEVGAAARKSPPNTHAGPNERTTWPQADPAFVDHTFMEGAVLFHPHGFALQKELTRITLICLGGGDLSAFERGSDQDVRVYVRVKAA